MGQIAATNGAAKREQGAAAAVGQEPLLEAPLPRWAELIETVESVRPLVAEDTPCQVFAHWAREVSRFSFQSGRIMLVSRQEEVEEPARETATTA